MSNPKKEELQKKSETKLADNCLARQTERQGNAPTTKQANCSKLTNRKISYQLKFEPLTAVAAESCKLHTPTYIHVQAAHSAQGQNVRHGRQAGE